MKPDKNHINLHKHHVINVLTLILVMFFATSFGFSQQAPISPEYRELLMSKLEEIAEQTDEQHDYTDLLEDLYFFLDNPLNLNYATFDQMKKLIFLSELQIHKIVEYRNVYGQFATISELMAIDGFDRELIEFLEPMISVAPEKPKVSVRMADVFRYGRSDLFLRYTRVLEKQAGYADVPDSVKYAKPSSYFLGSPDRYYLRYGFNYFNKVRIGLTAEKDPGEEFFKGSQPNGFDFYSGFIMLSEFAGIDQFVVGDYQLEFGQGLTLWTGLSFGKSPDAFGVMKNQRRIRPNTSVNENRYLRGTAVTYAIRDFRITGFYSTKNIDANLETADTISQEEQFVTSLQETGYHRTPTEVANKKAIHETLYGGNIRYRVGKFQAGATAFKTLYDKPIRVPDQLYRKYEFRGTENFNYGFDVNFILNRFNFFAEASGSENGGKAYLAGFQASLHPSVSLSAYYRNFDVDYQNLYSNAIAENSSNQNERGLFAGLLVYLHRNWTFRGYTDMFSSPWLRYRIDAPSNGKEFLAQLDYHPNRRLDMYFRYRSKQKQLNESGDLVTAKVGETHKESFRFFIAYQATKDIILKNRLEFLRYKQPDKNYQGGFLIYQDFIFQPPAKPYDVTFRYALFDTDSYDERIYAYENDLLYVFSIPAYYYKGSRFYVMLRYDIARNIDFWLRLSQAYYSNKTTIGSGTTEIDGNTYTEIKAQLRIKF